eukprot:910252-Prorocentrum_minimum.AAC.1
MKDELAAQGGSNPKTLAALETPTSPTNVRPARPRPRLRGQVPRYDNVTASVVITSRLAGGRPDGGVGFGPRVTIMSPQALCSVIGGSGSGLPSQCVVGLTAVSGPDPAYVDVCYKGAGADHDRLGEHFPTFTLEFGGGAAVTLAPVNYLFEHGAIAGAYCLGVFDNGCARGGLEG